MRALVHDRWGPPRAKRLVGAIGAAFVALGLGLVFRFGPEMPLRLLPLSVGLVTIAGVLAGLVRFRPRVVDVEVGPGRVRFERGPFGTSTIAARDVLGATTSHADGKIALTLTTTNRPLAPLTFVFEREDEAEKVRAALGISRDGKGESTFAIELPPLVRGARVLATIAGLLFAIPIAFAAAGGFGSEPFPIFAQTTMQGTGLLALALVLALLPVKPNAVRRVVLRPESAYVPGESGAEAVPYGDMIGVSHEGGRVRVSTASQTHDVKTSMTEAECSILVGHLDAARRRARGEGADRPPVAERLAFLRRNDEPAAVWLARIDGLATLASVPGYRGLAIDRADLLAALDDTDLEPDLRVASSRLLARLDPTVRVRIAETATSATSEGMATILRGIDAPLADLATAYEELDADERAAEKGRRA